DARDVEPGHGHQAAGHVLVAASEGEDAVVVHATGDDLDRVGDDLAGNERVAHAAVAHHDAVRRGGSAKDLRDPAGGADAFAALAGQAVEVGVAGGDVAEEGGDADHRTVEVVVVEADGAEHGPVGGPLRAAGGGEAGAIGRHDGSTLANVWMLSS